MGGVDIWDKRFSKGVLIDSNILLLLVVGATDPQAIPRFKRTAQFAPEDFTLLAKLLDRFARIVTTPSVLTEVNGLLGQFKLGRAHSVRDTFGSLIDPLVEEYTPSRAVRLDPLFTRLGLTDAGMKMVASQGLLVLTDDLDLAVALERSSVDVLNFNHVRSWFAQS